MDPHSRWKYILSRFRRQLPLDIEHCSPLTVRQLVLNVRTPAAVLDRIAHVYCDDEGMLKDLVRCPNLSETSLAFIALSVGEEMQKYIAGTRAMDLVVVDDALAKPETALAAPGKAGAGEKEKKKLNLTQQLQRMSVSQKVKLAIMGGKEARGILIRETNKQISLNVLENPRITDGEVEFFANSKNMSEDILRTIGNNQEWSKKYSIAVALINNGKTPVGVALPLVNRMTDKDLGMLEKSRNVSEAVRTAARGLLLKRKKTK